MALRVVTVKSSGGDYSSLNAAFAGEVGDLTAAGLNRQLEIDCYNFVDTTAANSGAGWTTDATHSVLVVAVDNHNGFFGGVGGAASYYLNTSSASALIANIPFATFRGLSLQSTSAFGLAAGLSGASARMERVLCANTSVAAVPAVQVDGDNTHGENCLFVVAAGGGGAGFVSLAVGSVSVDNCTAYNGGFQPGSGMAARNCVAAGTQTTGFQPGTWTGSANCASTDSTSPSSGSGHRINQSITLYNPASGDYRLKWTDLGAKGYGTNLSADPTYPFSVDIANTARTDPWDIGAYVAIPAPINDVYLRSVPSDTNPNDVRLYPFTADNNTGTVTAASEASTDAAGDERLAATVTASSEGSGAAVGDERLAATITASSEASAAAAGDERLAATITGSSEASGAAAGDERITGTATGSSEASGAATADERSVATVTASSEGSGDLVGDERLVATITGSSEAFGDAVGDAREAGSIAGSSESFADAVGSARSVGSVAASSEAFADVVGVIRITGTITASSEASANAIGESRIASIEVSGGGNKGHWYEPRERAWTTRITGRIEAGSGASVEAHGTEHIGGHITADSRATLGAGGIPRIVGRVRASSESGVTISAEITEPWQIEDEELLVLLMSGELELV